MLRHNPNILGFLQKQSFFQAREKKSLSPRSKSRFTKDLTNQPQSRQAQLRTPPKTSKSRRFETTGDHSSTRNKTIQELQSQSRFKYQRQAISKQYRHQTGSKESLANSSISASKQPIINMNQNNSSHYEHQKFSKNQEFVMQAKSRITDSQARLPTQYSNAKGNGKNPSKMGSNRNFESSKIQSKMCLQDLNTRIGIELSLVDKLIGELTVSFQSKFHHRLFQLKQQINRVIEEVFAQAKSNWQAKMFDLKQHQINQILEMKFMLKEKTSELAEMKQKMETNWRKVAGQLLANQTDKKIQSLIYFSGKMRDQMYLSQQSTGPQHSNIKQVYFGGKEKKPPLDTFMSSLKSLTREIIQKSS